MKVRITYSDQQVDIDQEFSGATADAVVGAMQKEVAGKLGFAIRLFVNTLSPTQFAQEVVRRYNQTTSSSLPVPGSCLEFIRLGEREGIVKVTQP